MDLITRVLHRIALYIRSLPRRLRRPAAPGAGQATTARPRQATRSWVPVGATSTRLLDPRRLLGAITQRIVPGHEIGSGGQGRVYVVQGRSDLVVKRFIKPIPGALADFERLIEAKDAVQSRLADTRIDLCWPEKAEVAGDTLTGYVMPVIASDYLYSSGWRGKDRERQLAFAVREVSAVKLPFTVNDEQRAELVWLVARFLDAMHSEGLAYGDISWANFNFQLDPEVRLAVYDFDSTRVIGRRTMTRQPAARTPGWEDPRVQGGEPASFDTDRYRFALLAYRMLVSRTLHDDLDPAQVPDRVITFDDLQSRHMRSLWIRAVGERGTRPTIQEWRRALEG